MSDPGKRQPAEVGRVESVARACAADVESRYTGANLAVTARSSPYPVSRLSAPISLVDAARRIEAASEVVALRTNAKLEEIAEQIKKLQDRARQIVDAAERDLELHRAECRFQCVTGRVYHLFERADGARFFSMLGPSELVESPTRRFVASYRYDADRSWTRVDDSSVVD